MKLKDVPTLTAAAIGWSGVNLRQAEEIESRDVPEEWEDRFRKAEEACYEMESTPLDEHLPQSVLSGLSSVVDGDEDTLETFANGDQSIVDHLCVKIDNGFIALEVLNALREGELIELMQV